MGLYEARGNLGKSLKELLAKWEYTKGLWNDPQSDAVEKETLVALEKDVRIAGEAMDHMKLILMSAKRDCQQ